MAPLCLVATVPFGSEVSVHSYLTRFIPLRKYSPIYNLLRALFQPRSVCGIYSDSSSVSPTVSAMSLLPPFTWKVSGSPPDGDLTCLFFSSPKGLRSWLPLPITGRWRMWTASMNFRTHMEVDTGGERTRGCRDRGRGVRGRQGRQTWAASTANPGDQWRLVHVQQLSPNACSPEVFY